jgi:hypothetical protein
MVLLAMETAEKQMREGTASAQVITHFLKLGSSREVLEQERLARENELLEAKKDAMASAARIEELMSEAINAFRAYSGQPVAKESDDYED